MDLSQTWKQKRQITFKSVNWQCRWPTRPLLEKRIVQVARDNRIQLGDTWVQRRVTNTGSLLKLSRQGRHFFNFRPLLRTGARELARFVDQKRSSFHNLASVPLSLSPSNFRHYGDCSTSRSRSEKNESINFGWTYVIGRKRAGLVNERSIESLPRVKVSRTRATHSNDWRSSRSWEWKRFTRHRGVKRSPFLVAVDGYAGVYKFGSSPRFKFNEKAHGSSVAQKLSRACHVCIFHPPW